MSNLLNLEEKNDTKKITAAVMAAAVLAVTAPTTGVLPEPFTEMANAEETEGDFKYEVNKDGETVTVCKYIGTAAKVDIPIILGGKSVTEIGLGAFMNCTSLVSVTIPDDVGKIANQVFQGCTALESVTISASVMEIGYNAFNKCLSLKDINYDGTKDQWNEIDIDKSNNCLKNISIHCTDGDLFFGGDTESDEFRSTLPDTDIDEETVC